MTTNKSASPTKNRRSTRPLRRRIVRNRSDPFGLIHVTIHPMPEPCVMPLTLEKVANETIQLLCEKLAEQKTELTNAHKLIVQIHDELGGIKFADDERYNTNAEEILRKFIDKFYPLTEVKA